MKSIENRLKRLEAGQVDDFQGNLGILVLMHKIEHGAPSAETMKELKAKAQVMVNQGITFSIKDLLRRIDGKGLPRPGEQK